MSYYYNLLIFYDFKIYTLTFNADIQGIQSIQKQKRNSDALSHCSH